jgi:asparagine synthase (glutamine-hydrolysing)
MCGIAGKLAFNFNQMVSSEEIQRMCNTLTHRGPDDEGLYVNGPIGLGHRRLSIIDLDSGKQPISNEDRTIWTVFNGEIYNYAELKESLVNRGHVFSTMTDTEVIVHLYEEQGEDFLSSLRGMFAIALWDDRRHRLLLARDRIGKKPLFYSIVAENALVFGSEIKAILQDSGVKRQLNIEALDAYLALLYVPAPLTMFKGIEKLPPGHLLVCENGKINIREFWDLHYQPREATHEEELIEELECILEESVRIRLRSDVPIAAFLSGGVDSSSVVSIMARLMTRPVVTCAVGFEDEEHNELSFAKDIAHRFGCTHHEHLIKSDVANLVPRIVSYFDEPFGDSSAIPTYYVSQMARRHATVVLSGDGGDEVFAGYSRHYLQQLECRLRGFLPGSAGRSLAASASRWLPKVKGRATFKKLAMMPDQAYAYKHSHSLFTEEEKPRLYSADLRVASALFDPTRSLRDYYNRCDAPDALDKALYVDMKTYLPDDILVKVDRMSMAHSLEIRSPLLDHKLIEFTAKLPSSLKLKSRTTKYLLKQVMRKYLPTEVLTRPKHGFTMPLGQWLKGPLRDMVEDCLSGPAATQRGLFNKSFIQTLWSAQLSARGDHSHQLWMLLMFELWHRQYLDTPLSLGRYHS